MSAFPPRERLAHVVASLVRRLPDQCATLLAADRFAEGREAIARLADVQAAAAGARAMAPAEADWMADLLLQRWARIAPVDLDPAVAIAAPEAIWLGPEPCEVPLTIATLGLDDGWQADWSGDVWPSEDGREAVLRVPAKPQDDRPTRWARVRVIGRAGGSRCVVGASCEIRLCRPVLSLSADRLTLTLRDDAGNPGAGAPLTIDGTDHLTDAAGRVTLAMPMAPQAQILVAGQPVPTPIPDGGDGR